MNWKKYVAVFAAAMTAAAVLAGCGGTGASEQNASAAKSDGGDKVLRIAIQPSATWAPLWYLKDTGRLEQALKDKGITVKWTEFESGPPMNESFAAGQQDIGVGGDVPVVAPLAKGQKNVIIAQGGKGDQTQAVVVGKDSGITDPAQLKGKKIGITVGSSAHHMLYSLLAKYGYTLKDVDVINITAGDAETALLNKQVDAVVFWEPNVTFLIDKGAGNFLIDQKGLPNGGGPIFATAAYAKDHQDVIKIVLQEYAKAAKEIKADPAKAAPTLAPHFHCTPEQMVKIIGEYSYPVTFGDDDAAGLQETADFLHEIGIIKKELKVKEFIDAATANSLQS